MGFAYWRHHRGLGFAGAQFFKTSLISFGNPKILEWKGVVPGTPRFNEISSAWANWQNQNWHSFFEQTYGFINGIAVAVALGLLASRINLYKKEDLFNADISKSGKWTRVFSILFVLLGVTYFNVPENVEVWSKALKQDNWQTVTTLPEGYRQRGSGAMGRPIIGAPPGNGFFTLVTGRVV